MNNKLLRYTVLLLVLGLAVLAAGVFYYNRVYNKPEPLKKVIIGMPVLAFPPRNLLIEGFKKGMEDLGYQEGINIEYREPTPLKPNPEGLKKAEEIYAGFVADDVDLIVVNSNQEAEIALAATKDNPIPIVGLDLFNPVEKGLAESYRSSGKNLTGIGEQRSDTLGKLLEFILKIQPNAKRVGVLSEGFMNPSKASPASDMLKALKSQAQRLGMTIVEYTTEASPGPELEEAMDDVLASVDKTQVDAWVHIPGHFVPNQHLRENEMAKRVGILFALPAALEIDPETGEIAGLFAFSVDFKAKGIQGARQADKILRGEAVENIPLEPPREYELVVNMRVAEEAGIEVPQEVINLANKVIR